MYSEQDAVVIGQSSVMSVQSTQKLEVGIIRLQGRDRNCEVNLPLFKKVSAICCNFKFDSKSQSGVFFVIVLVPARCFFRGVFCVTTWS